MEDMVGVHIRHRAVDAVGVGVPADIARDLVRSLRKDVTTV
jgi:hypothetical protein